MAINRPPRPWHQKRCSEWQPYVTEPYSGQNGQNGQDLAVKHVRKERSWSSWKMPSNSGPKFDIRPINSSGQGSFEPSPTVLWKKPSSPHGAEAATSGGCMASWVDVDVDPVLQLGKRFKKPLARLSRTLNMLKFFNVPLKMFWLCFANVFYIYIHIYYVYIYIYICMYVWMDGWMEGWMDGCMHACMYACMHACTNVCAYVRTCIRTYVSMYECMNVWTYECIY